MITNLGIIQRLQEMEEEIVCNRWKDLAGDQMKEWPGLDKKAVTGHN